MFDPQRIVLASELEDLRIDPRIERRPDGTPVLARIRRGAYYDAAEWLTFNADTRYAARVHATAMFARSAHIIYSHWSAAVLWGMPIIESWPREAHTTKTGGVIRSSGLVKRHHMAQSPPSAIVDGVRITTAARTVVDLARDGSLQSAVAAADHGLRHRLCTRSDLAAETRSDLAAELEDLEAGTAGISSVRTTLLLADPHAESALESLSRVAMYELRLPQPELQLPLADGEGEFGRGDFGWPGLVGECDGYGKYVRYLRHGETPGDVVYREKRREDRVRRSGLDIARWGWDDALSRVGLLSILTDKGLRRMPRRNWH